ncbi:MAG: hypothetical protein SWO11_22140 [Thermodesulfobacteriota bacterium]|nr:hypothetical protein [Thermodesulfobacteriota bacterium]
MVPFQEPREDEIEEDEGGNGPPGPTNYSGGRLVHICTANRLVTNTHPISAGGTQPCPKMDSGSAIRVTT